MAEFSFDTGVMSVDEIERLTSDMWADLAFDREALSALRRDGIALEGINLGGPNPYRFERLGEKLVNVTATGPDQEILLDLFRVHFQRGMRPRNIAA